MIPLREDNTSNMTLDGFRDAIIKIYQESFPKSYIEMQLSEGMANQYRLTVAPCLQDRANHYYADPIYWNSSFRYNKFRVSFGLNLDGTINGNVSLTATKFELVLVDDDDFGWDDGEDDLYVKKISDAIDSKSCTPEDVLDWFEKVTMKLHRVISRFINDPSFDKGLADDYKEYL